jgi:ABC-type nitrate/sulfonate/bicarbonate transport system substrate-binding protein
MGSNFDKELSRREFLRKSAMLGAAGVVASSLASPLAKGFAQEVTNTAALRFQPSWIPDVQNGGVYAAIYEGYYTKERLAVTILPGGPGILGGAVIDSGGAEVGEMASSVDLVKAVSQGMKLKTFGTVFQRSPAGLVYIKRYPDGKKGEDFSAGLPALKGKRIGITGGVNLPWRVMCTTAGLDPEKDFQIVSTGFDLSPLLDGTVKAIWCFLTNQPGMVKGMGYDLGVIDSYEWGYKVPGNFLVAKPAFLNDRFDLAKRFLSATRKGWEFTNTDKGGASVCEKITKVLAPNYGTKLEQQLAQRKDQIPFMESALTKKKGLLYVNFEDWESAIKIMKDIGEIEKVPKVEDLATTAVLDSI